MAWLTKIALTDYQIVQWNGITMIQDTRNRRSFSIAPHVVEDINKNFPNQNPIVVSIGKALVPHPYDEWV